MWNAFDKKEKKPVDLANYNYGTEQDKIKQRRALAQALGKSSMEQDRGQMVPGGPNGFYVAPSALSPIVKMLTAYLSKKGMDDADEAQSQADKDSVAALAYQLENLNKGKTQEVAATEGSNSMEVAPLTDEELGPTQFETIRDPVQREPVKQVETTPPVSKKALAAALGVSTNNSGMTPQQMERAMTPVAADNSILAPGAMDNLSAIGTRAKDRLSAALKGVQSFTGADGSKPTWEQPKPAAFGGAGGSWDAAPEQTAPAAPAMPQIALAAAPNAPAAVAPAPTQQARYSAPAAPYSNAVPSTPEFSVQGEPTREEFIARLSTLAQTGPAGARIAEAQLQNVFGGKGEYEVTPIKDKDTGDITAVLKFNKRTGAYIVDPLESTRSGDKVLETKDTPQGIMERTRSGWRLARDGEGNVVAGKEAQDTREKQAAKGGEIDSAIQIGEDLKKSFNALTKIDPKTGKPVVDAASGLGGRLSILYNTITRDPTKASLAQSEIDGLKAKVFNYGMAKIRSAGGGAGAANSDIEGKRIEQALGNLDIGVLGTEGFIKKANEIISDIDASAARYEGMARQQGAPLQTRQPGAAPQPMSYDAFKAGR